MKYYVYVEPAGNSSETVYTIMSELAILAQYWDYWYSRAQQVVGALEGLSTEQLQQRCVEDFCTIHWAVPATPEHLTQLLWPAPNTDNPAA